MNTMDKIIDKIIDETHSQSESIVEKNNTSNNIYESLGVVVPFTVLVDEQFNSFIGELSSNKGGILNQTEQEAFKELWYAAGVDIGGTGNNIWYLKKGSFDIFNKNGVAVKYEKKNAEVKDKYSSDNARANFVYLSNDGNFVISQNDRNQKVFLVYVSQNITDRLLKVLRDAEAKALNIQNENIMSNTVLNTMVDTAINGELTENIESNMEIDAPTGKRM